MNMNMILKREKKGQCGSHVITNGNEIEDPFECNGSRMSVDLEYLVIINAFCF